MKTINIKNTFATDYISRKAGETLRHLILSHATKDPVELDFTGIMIASTSFFDEAIAKLLLIEGWDEKRIKRQVQCKGINPMDKELLEDLIRLRAEIF